RRNGLLQDRTPVRRSAVRRKRGETMRWCAMLVGLAALQPAGAQMLEPPAFLEFSLPAGAFDEMCFELEPGKAMRYAFDAAAPLDFNIHWHRGSKVLFPVKSPAVARRGGVFASSDKQDYCLMWTNHGRSPVALRARIDRAD